MLNKKGADEIRVFKNNILNRADTFLGKLVLGMAILAGFLTLTMTLVICYSVVVRYFFNISVEWAIEYSEYLIYINVMLATPWVLKIDKHVRVDILSQILPQKAQRGLNIFISILGIVMCSIFFYFSLNETTKAFESGINLVRVIPVKKWIVMSIMPVMSGFSVILFLRKIVVMLTHKEIQSDCDYQDFERSLMNPKYDTSISTDICVPTYDDIVAQIEEEKLLEKAAEEDQTK